MKSEQPAQVMLQGRKNRLLHPISLYLAGWGSVVFLYSLHLSKLLIFSTATVLSIACWAFAPFAATVFLAECWHFIGGPRSDEPAETRIILPGQYHELDKILNQAFKVWALLTVMEIIVSGGIPSYWLIRGIPKNYFDFGIPSIHGMLNSLLLSIALFRLAFFFDDQKKKHLIIPAFVVIWSILVITRNLMTVMLIEAGMASALLRGFSWKAIRTSIFAFVSLILVFGYVGDFRTGADHFIGVAQPSNNYPTWLPSGVLWIYIYLTTPVGNLVNTAVSTPSLGDPLFPNTVALLFPSVLREMIYGNTSTFDAVSGTLISDAFNVSTAYMGPYQDYGRFGIALYSCILALAAMHYWHRNGLNYKLIYAVIAQCVLLSVFFNHLFYLPVITQAVWIHLFYNLSMRRTQPPAS